MMLMMNNNCNKMLNWVHGLKPIMLMVIAQVGFAGVNIFYKLAANDGMNLHILIAYRFLFAAAFIVPLAFFLERKSRPKLTWKILGQAFLCGLFGGTLSQNLYLEGLVLTSATFASAMANLVPAVTFVLAVSFRLEKVSIRTLSGKAKILGTLLGVSGAMLLTFYKGVEIKMWSINSHLLKPSNVVHNGGHNRLIGALLCIGSCFSYAAWLIVQAKMSQGYPCYYSSTALMSIMGAVQSVVFALSVERDWSQWKLGWNIRLLASAYSGIVASGMMVTLIAWCILLRGPLFVSIFSPSMLVMVALAGSLILNETLHLGSVLGALLIVLGLYAVLWGKGKEIKKMSMLVPSTTDKDLDGIEDDEERQLSKISSTTKHNSTTEIVASEAEGSDEVPVN